MAKSSPKKGGQLGHRDLQRTSLVFGLLSHTMLTSTEIRQGYYSGLSEASFHKTFKRDREELEAEGVYVKETRKGTAKDYALDTDRTLAKVKGADKDDFVALSTMMRPLAEDPATPNRRALGSAITRIALSSCAGPKSTASPELDCKPEVQQAVSQAMQSRKPLSFSYQSLADDEPKERTIKPYGMFTLLGSAYVVAERHLEGSPDAIRTYNLSRAVEASVKEDAEPYQVPDDFNLKDWQLKPFEIGPDDAEAIIYARRKQSGLLKAQAPSTGELVNKQGGVTLWQGHVKNVAAAASWCVQYGFLPLEPPQLVKAWQQLLEEALNDES